MAEATTLVRSHKLPALSRLRTKSSPVRRDLLPDANVALVVRTTHAIYRWIRMLRH